MKVIARKDNVSRIAHDVNHPAISWVEVLVTLDNTRPGKVAQEPLALRVHVGNDLLYILERNRPSGVEEVRHQKSRPGIAAARVRDNERVLRVNVYPSPCDIQPQHTPAYSDELANQGQTPPASPLTDANCFFSS